VLVGLREWVKANPWRPVAIVLGLGLIGSLIALALAGGEDPEVGVAGSTTTLVTEPGASTTLVLAEEGPPLEVDPNTPTQGLGSAYVSVKVDNAPGARPQVGLANVPPVDADLLFQLAPYVVSTGGEPFVVQDVAATGISMIDAQLFELFTLGENPEPLHNLFLLLEELFQTVGDTPQLGGGLPAGVFPGGDGAAEVTLPYESVTYRYEGEEYVRYQGGSPFEVLDGIGGTPVALAHDTLVVLYVAERPAGYTDGNDVPVSTFDIIGLGDLLVFHQGEVVGGTWLRGAQEDPYRFFDTDGNPFGLPQGRTYLALVPRDSEVGY
jgi:hypothetical protein